MSYKVYRYTFPNGLIYIGVTKNSLQERKDCGYQHNIALKTAIREYGWAMVQKDILCEVESLEEAFKAEESLIASHKATDPTVGYNISHGGASTYKGLKHSDEYRQRMSDLYLGRHFSEETLQRMRDAHSKERKPVIRLASDGSQKFYVSLTEAAADVAGHKTSISRAIKARRPYKGFSWMEGGDEG